MKGWKWFTIIVLILFMGMVLYSCSQKKQGKLVDVGYTMKARRNPFLAAEKFLKKRDIDAEAVAKFQPGKLPNSYKNGVVVSPFQGIPLDGPGFDSLVKWVRSGNVLICGNTRRSKLESVSMTAKCRRFFGLASQTPLKKKIDITETLSLQDKAGYTQDYVVTMQLSHHIKPVKNAETFYRDKDNCLGYSIIQGEGEVIIVNDFSIFSNKLISKEDHASLLENLILSHTKDGSQVQLIYRSAFDDTAWAWIWRNCKVFLLITLLFTTVFILRKSIRFGPTLPEPEPVRRQLMEHISACGKYSWNSPEGAHKLLTNLRLNIMEKLHRSHPMIENLSQQEMTKELAKMTGISTTRLYKALVANQNEVSEFTDIVKTLQEVRKAL